MDEPLADYLDRLIQAAYVVTERGVGRKVMEPSAEDVQNLIEDEVWGRPIPIEDSADHFLLMGFDRVRREYLAKDPVPDWNFDVNGTVVLSGNRKVDGDSFHGEILWRALHVDSGWLCRECGHPNDGHFDDDGGGPITDSTKFTYCEVGKCSCGMRIGR